MQDLRDELIKIVLMASTRACSPIQTAKVYSLRFDAKSTCGPRAMLSCFTIKRANHYSPNWFNCLIVCLFGQSQASIILKPGSHLSSDSYDPCDQSIPDIPDGRRFLRRDRKNWKNFYFKGTVPDGPRRRRFLTMSVNMKFACLGRPGCLTLSLLATKA